MKIAYLPLKQYSRFHFGEMKIDHDLALSDTGFFAHSDTLFAALVNAYVVHDKVAVDNFIRLFEQKNIQLSSLFYYVQQGDSIIHFLPKPVFVDMNSPKTKDKLHKRRNRIKMVSVGVWLNGFDAVNWFDETKYKVIQDTFVMTKEEFDSLQTNHSFDIMKIMASPKSPKRGPTNAAIYYQSDVIIGGSEEVQIGWYFMYEAKDAAEIALQIATNIMAYTGIGGEIRNMGRTIPSKPVFKEQILINLKEASHYINVSLINPKSENDFNAIHHYKTTLRGGRKLSTDGFAKVVRMITEGALIEGNSVEGQLVDLGKDEANNTLYRNGLPFLIPVQYDY